MTISVLLFIICLLAGFIVSYNYLAEKFSQLDQIKDIVNSTRIYIGIAGIIIGFWSILRQDIIYDLFPAIFSIASGLVLATVVFKYFNLSADHDKSEERKSKIQDALEKYNTLIGFGTLIFAIVHLIDLIVASGEIPFI